MLSRRQFLWRTTTSGVLLPLVARAQEARGRLFRHGVASGDPQADAVILWTRVTPGTSETAPLQVRWHVATDPALAKVVQSGTVAAAEERDFTVKIDVRALRSGTTYYYAFDSAGERSPVGRTKTLPASSDRLRLATISCSNYPAGFFNVYRILAGRQDLDAVVHLGDYLYEFADGEYGDGKRLNRVPQPEREAITLRDYRQRYATYRSDPDLQEAHRQHPFVAVWDDHESANDAWRGGGQNHDPATEGPWSVRRAAAWRAYTEWMPVRVQADSDIKLYRSLRFGTLVDLIMLDARSLRDQQAPPDDAAGLANPARRMLGAAQESWLYDTMRQSSGAGVAWRLIGQQVLFSRVMPPGRPVQFNDAWEGYQAERGRIVDFLERQRARNVAILTGDLHSSWALDVPRSPWSGYSPQNGTGSLAVEIVCPAISSPGLMTAEQARTIAPALRVAVPSIRYLEGQRQGYVLLDLTRQRLRADWYHVPTVQERSLDEFQAASFVCESGSARLTPA